MNNEVTEATCEAAPPELCTQVDDALGLQMISIRFPKGTLNHLKNLAAEVGIGYQPMIRMIIDDWLTTHSAPAAAGELLTEASTTKEASGPATVGAGHRCGAWRGPGPG